MELVQPPLPLVEDDTDDHVTCVRLGCGKYRQTDPPSIFCPMHNVTAEWEAAEPERQKERAKRRRDERKTEEAFLASSPLAACNPNFVERSGRNRRTRPSPIPDERSISNPDAKFQPDPDPLAEILADVG